MISYIINKFWLVKPDISIKLFVCNEIDLKINQFPMSMFSNLSRYLSDVCEILRLIIMFLCIYIYILYIDTFRKTFCCTFEEIFNPYNGIKLIFINMYIHILGIPLKTRDVLLYNFISSNQIQSSLLNTVNYIISELLI